MTKNELDKKSISSTLADTLAYFVLELGQITENSKPFAIFKIYFKGCINGIFGYVRYTSLPLTKPKETFFAYVPITINL